MQADMGAILSYDGDSLELSFEVLTHGAIERVEVRNRMDVVETLYPYDEASLGSRIRIVWEGSEYRGRGRQTVWDGSATLEGNASWIRSRSISGTWTRPWRNRGRTC